MSFVSHREDGDAKFNFQRSWRGKGTRACITSANQEPARDRVATSKRTLSTSWKRCPGIGCRNRTPFSESSCAAPPERCRRVATTSTTAAWSRGEERRGVDIVMDGPRDPSFIVESHNPAASCASPRIFLGKSGRSSPQERRRGRGPVCCQEKSYLGRLGGSWRRIAGRSAHVRFVPSWCEPRCPFGPLLLNSQLSRCGLVG